MLRVKDFLSNGQTLRKKSRENIDKGPVTDAYRLDMKRVIHVLNQALATELVCGLRYRRHFFTAQGLNAQAAATEFLELAGEGEQHTDRIAARISQLGEEPDFNPEWLTGPSHSQWDSSVELEEMIREDLVVELVAITSYTEIVAWLGQSDPTIRRMIEEILAVEVRARMKTCLIS